MPEQCSATIYTHAYKLSNIPFLWNSGGYNPLNKLSNVWHQTTAKTDPAIKPKQKRKNMTLPPEPSSLAALTWENRSAKVKVGIPAGVPPLVAVVAVAAAGVVCGENSHLQTV